MALTAIPIHPSNLAPGHCPWCRRPARHRHCDECYWLVCMSCGVTWSERTGGWFSEVGLQGNRNEIVLLGDERDGDGQWSVS